MEKKTGFEIINQMKSTMAITEETEIDTVAKQHNGCYQLNALFDEMAITDKDKVLYRIRINDPERGRGLYATQEIAPFTHIHTAPCIYIPTTEYDHHLKFTELNHYVFNCPGGGKMVALGHGSLFNHDGRSPNVDYRVDREHCCIRYCTGHRIVKCGEELCICYGSRIWWGKHEKEGDDSSSSSDDGDPVSFLNRIKL